MTFCQRSDDDPAFIDNYMFVPWYMVISKYQFGSNFHTSCLQFLHIYSATKVWISTKTVV